MQKIIRCELVIENDTPKFRQYLNGVRAEQTEWDGKWNSPVLTYSILKGTEDVPGDSAEFQSMGIALTTWGAEIPIKFKRVKSTENPNLRLEWKTSLEEPYFKERPSTLAFAYYPDQGSISGQIVFNDDYIWGKYAGSKRITNPDGSISNVKVYSMIIVLIHELGHSLGLTHDEHDNTADIMDPYYNENIYELSGWDIIRITTKYGRRIFSNWNLYQRLKEAISNIKSRR